MSCKNIKISDPQRLLLNLTDKIDLKRKDKYIALSNLNIHEKMLSHIRTLKLKYQLQDGMENLNYLMDHILYQIFKINLNIF